MSSKGIAGVLPLLGKCSYAAVSGPRNVKERAANQEAVSLISQDTSDEFLLMATADGSKESIGLLFRRHRRAVLNVALRILKDVSEAEDLCQEVFLLLFQKAKLFDASKGTAASWIIQITYHRAINRRQYLTFRQHYNAEQLNEEQIDAKGQPLFIDELIARTLLNRVRE
jgi:RNA polymerase sigma-70 factor (ECF subfamily)